MKTVMAMGTFDMLHPGHLSYLEEAKKHGDHLVVVVARDKTVEKERGRTPVVEEKDRLRLVQQLRVVDEAMLGNVGDKLVVVEQVKPDVICLGYDQKVDQKALEKELLKRGLHIKVIRIGPYKEKVYKSSILKQKGFKD
jgi:FAD synthetase